MKEKFNSIDLFKFLMAIVVVVYHTNPFVNCKNSLDNEVIRNIADVTVPFFFMASGYFIGLKWGDTSQQRERTIRKMLVSTFQLYTTWTLFSLPLTLYGYVISGNSAANCVFSYVKYFLFVGKLYNSYHLWYLLAMLYALLAMWILVRKGKGTGHILMAGVLFHAVYLLAGWIRQGGDADGLLAAAGKAFYFVFNNGMVFTGMLYMGIGIYIREHHRIRMPVSVLGIAAGVLVKYVLSQELGIIISAVMYFTLVLNIRLPDHTCYAVLRELSKYIYLVHLMCFSFYTFIVLGQPNKQGVDSFLATYAMAVAVSAVILYVKKYLKGRGSDKR